MLKTFDIAIQAGQCLTLKDGSCAVETDLLIGIEKEKISFVGKEASLKNWSAKKTIDAKNKVVFPGMVNSHCHLPMSLFRGLADDLSFGDWLNKYILPLEARLVDPEFVQLGTELSILESLMSGCTTLYDMYYFEDSIAEVVDRTGARALLGETVFDFVAPDNKEKNGNDYKILEKLVERYSTHPRITPMIAPHAPYSCSDETLKKAVLFAAKKNIPLGIHVSETLAEVHNSLKEFKKTPVQRLFDLGVTGEKSIFAHCVHLNDEDIQILAKSKTSVAHNPECNMKLGSGVAPVPKLLSAGVVVGLGTDGPSSNNDLSLFKEMDCAAKVQKLTLHDNTAMTAEKAFHMATLGSAQALKLAHKIGSLEVGKLADITIFDPRHPHIQPVHSIVSALVYSATGLEVDTVLCHGKLLVEKRKCLTIDQEDLFSRIDRYRKRVSL